MFFILSKLATALLLPPGLFLVLLALSFFLLARGRKRPGLVIGGLALGLLWILSTGPVADALLRGLEDAQEPLSELGLPHNLDPGAPVVVLGGGVVARSPEEGGLASLRPDPLKRLSYGLGLARRLGRPLVFSGGTVYPGLGVEPEAAAARRFVEAQGGWARASYEDQSRTTLENATRIKEGFGASTIILVTSAYHMPRARLAFRKAGIEAIPAPTDYKVDRVSPNLAWCLPSMEALRYSWIALHEYLGLLGYGLKP